MRPFVAAPARTGLLGLEVREAVWWLLWFLNGMEYGLAILFRDHLILYDAISSLTIILLGALAIVVTGRRMTFRPSGLSGLVLLLNLANIISVLLSPVEFENPLRIYVAIIVTLVLSITVIVVAQEGRGSTLLSGLGRAYALGMMGTVLAPLAAGGFATLLTGRYGVEGLISPNQIGFGAAIALVFAVSGIGRGPWAIFDGALAVLFATTLIFTFSKTSLIAVAVSLGLMWVLSGGNEKFGVRCARAAVVFIPLAVLWNRLSGEIAVYLQTTGASSTLSGRTLLWEAVLNLSAQHPWLGYGFGTSREVLRPYSATWDTDITHAHNAYLTALLQTGIIGAVLLVLIAFMVLRIATRLGRFRQQPVVRLWMALVCLILIHSMTEGAIGRGGSSLALLVALGVIGDKLGAGERHEGWQSSERAVPFAPPVVLSDRIAASGEHA
jgi:O-antigen ligase